MLRFFCFLTVLMGVRSAAAPFIKPCKAGDRDCIIASANAVIPVVAPGIPALGIPSMDPLRLEHIKGDQAGLKLSFTNTEVKGMRGCVIEGVKQDLSQLKQALFLRCSVTLDGEYELGGNLLFLPVQGKGKYNIKIRDIIIKAYTEMTIVDDADGKPHWHIAKWHHKYNVKTSTEFHFENLFNGNAVLADPIHQFVNQNWREVMTEVAPPIVYSIVEGVVKGVEAIYKAVPADELYFN